MPGLILGLPVALLSNAVNFSALTTPAVSFLWILVAFVGWGLALAALYNELLFSHAGSPTPAAEASVQALDRRSFLLRMGGAAATVTVVGAGVGALLRESGSTATPVRLASSGGGGDLPNADAALQPVPGTRAELTPVEKHYRIDISSRPPVLEEETWTLPVSGLVDNPLEMTLADLRSEFQPVDQYLTLACISNRVGGDLIGTQKWTGLRLQDLLGRAKLQEDAQYLRIFGGDGFHETVDIDLINSDERIMLAYAWDDLPLPERNGFPLRIYIPDRYGMKQPKWITGIEVVADYQQGYWVTRGWDEEALMQTTSVVDVVATDEAFVSDGVTYIPVGGIAHAGDRSVSKVEVRMDNEEWQEAQLRDPLSDKTWVLWRFDMPFSEGRHRIEVRSVDGEGEAATRNSSRHAPQRRDRHPWPQCRVQDGDGIGSVATVTPASENGRQVGHFRRRRPLRELFLDLLRNDAGLDDKVVKGAAPLVEDACDVKTGLAAQLVARVRQVAFVDRKVAHFA